MWSLDLDKLQRMQIRKCHFWWWNERKSSWVVRKSKISEAGFSHAQSMPQSSSKPPPPASHRRSNVFGHALCTRSHTGSRPSVGSSSSSSSVATGTHQSPSGMHPIDHITTTPPPRRRLVKLWERVLCPIPIFMVQPCRELVIYQPNQPSCPPLEDPMATV